MALTKFLAYFFLLLCFGFGAAAQNSIDKAVYEVYDRLVGLDNSGLYSGTEFRDLYLNTDGSYRYFKGFDYVRGSVTYRGQYYSDVLLNYDLLEDKLLTRSNDKLGIFNVQLISGMVDSFSIYGKHFVRLANDELNRSGQGFFEEVYLGNDLDLYVKHVKKKKDRALRSGVQYRFINANYYLLKRNGSYFTINKLRDIRDIFPERKKDIRDFQRSYRRQYRNDPDAFMVRLIRLLDSPKIN